MALTRVVDTGWSGSSFWSSIGRCRIPSTSCRPRPGSTLTGPGSSCRTGCSRWTSSGLRSRSVERTPRPSGLHSAFYSCSVSEGTEELSGSRAEAHQHPHVPAEREQRKFIEVSSYRADHLSVLVRAKLTPVLVGASRELTETVEENTQLRKQVSDLVAQNEQQVRSLKHVVPSQLQSERLMFFQGSELMNTQQSVTATGEVIRGLEQKIEQDKVSLRPQVQVNQQFPMVWSFGLHAPC